jgi:hypothetical protein
LSHDEQQTSQTNLNIHMAQRVALCGMWLGSAISGVAAVKADQDVALRMFWALLTTAARGSETMLSPFIPQQFPKDL